MLTKQEFLDSQEKNITLLGMSGAGKTTLAESWLVGDGIIIPATFKLERNIFAPIFAKHSTWKKTPSHVKTSLS